jgi:hypothetical protein
MLEETAHQNKHLPAIRLYSHSQPPISTIQKRKIDTEIDIPRASKECLLSVSFFYNISEVSYLIL